MNSLNQTKQNNGLTSKIIFGFAIFAFSFSVFSLSSAQTSPEFLVSWRALNFVPADYQGKSLPSKSSMVEIGFDVIDGNKLANLSRSNISWYLGNNQIASGVGMKTISVAIPTDLDQVIRMTVTGYNGADLDFGFIIPVSKPKIVLSTKTPTITAKNQRFLPVRSHLFKAQPFFFNVNNLRDLTFKWQVNSEIVSGTAGNPEFMSMELESNGTPKESQFTVSAAASNINNQLEFGSKSLNFIVK